MAQADWSTTSRVHSSRSAPAPWLAVARARHAKGESVSAIAKALGISRATLYRHLGGSA
ncbi:helix-turn-helix domain-containing protein [Streptomyces sp. NPDC088106]|uniref:helix-turn-helix domain-containing protein n=1 Tax=Streptomyces TaxID=1883 RepID=UPI00342B01E6